MPRLTLPAIACAAGYAAVALAIAAAALQFGQRRADGLDVPGAAPADPLAAALARCRGIGLAVADDRACKAAWAENRRRFFADGPAGGAGADED